MSHPLRLVSGIALTLIAATAQAQLPASRLTSIFPPGANPGKTVEVTVTGIDLDNATTLHFSAPGITAKQKMAEPGPFDKAPVPVPNTFEVTVAANVPGGVYDARVVGKYGTSNPRAFLISDQPVVVEVEPNNKKEEATEVELPALLSGQSNVAADVDYYRFTAAANQRILVDCFARRLDSLADMVVAAYDPAGRELDSSRDTQSGDPLLDFVTPVGGEYLIKVHESLYRGNNAQTQLYFTYQLAVGSFPHIDFVYPPVGAAGANASFTVYGRNLPGGQNAGIFLDGKPLQRLNATMPLPAAGTLAFGSRLEPESCEVDGKDYRIKGPQGWSNPVLVGIASSPVVIDKDPNNTADQAQAVTLPCEIAGQFYPSRDQDWYSFEAKKDEVIWLNLFSQRLGLRTDPSLVLQQVIVKEEGDPELKTIVVQDDAGSTEGGAEFDVRHDDPSYRFVVPADGTYRVLVRDTYSSFQDDPRNVYRLTIRTETPDFRLAAVPVGPGNAIHIRKGGRAAVRVIAFRRDGFKGEITVTATGMPGGTTVAPAIIGPGRNSATLVISAADNAPPATGQLQVNGTARIGNANVTRPARVGTLVHPLPPRQNNQPQLPGESRLSRNLVISISDNEPAPATVAAGENKVWETARAGILEIPYTIVRRNNFKGNVALTPSELPANINAPAVTANANTAAGNVKLTLAPTVVPGTYTFFLNTQAQNYSYSRNPEAAKAAADRKVEIDKIKTDADAAAKAAATKKTQADQLATTTTAAVTAATQKKAAADKAVTDAEAALTAATTKATQAKTAAATNAGDANLANVAKTAEAARVAETAKVQTAKTAADTAAKELVVAMDKAKAAADAKIVTDKENEDAIALAKAAAEAKTATDKLATDTANKAKPANRNVVSPSTPITIKITPAPITMVATSPTTPLKQGDKVEVPVTITRLYGYTPQVAISGVVPGGVGGLSIPNVNIAANQTAGKLVINAAANATPGQHQLIVRITVRFNNQNLTVDQPITLNVQKVEPAK